MTQLRQIDEGLAKLDDAISHLVDTMSGARLPAEEAGSNHALGLFLSLQKRNAPPIVLRSYREVQPADASVLL